jgi:hypothetical protein
VPASSQESYSMAFGTKIWTMPNFVHMPEHDKICYGSVTKTICTFVTWMAYCFAARGVFSGDCTICGNLKRADRNRFALNSPIRS